MVAEHHISVLGAREPIALSDCVLAIPTRSRAAAITLQGEIRERLESLNELYRATGAPYITIAKMASWLGELEVAQLRDEP